MQIPGAAVIPQTLPSPEDLFFRRLGQILQGRKLLHPAAKIVFHGFRTGLLEHDFRNPDMGWLSRQGSSRLWASNQQSSSLGQLFCGIKMDLLEQ